jgi:hypothetical protein
MPSTAIQSLHYQAPSRQLFVTFVTGREYVYDDVPPGIYEAFRAAGSRGRFFNAHIRDHYDFREITSLKAS